MKKLLILSVMAVVTASNAGCASCGRPFMSWFNRGDSCHTCANGGCSSGGDSSGYDSGGHIVHDDGSPGLLGSPMMHEDISAPRSMGILPGPVLNNTLPNGS